ncbi:MAG: NUDIX hydrolase [Anaerolineales bacterium]|jgi:ADP-ribose pyrophosphatase YjhB (NUDIX family)
MNLKVPQWLLWAREIQAIAQTGNTYAHDDYQRERYQRLQEIAAEMIAFHTQYPQNEIVPAFDIQKGYATPKVDVRSAVFQDQKLLFVREIADGGWTLPGGWADVGDVPSQAAEREVLEESGYIVRANRVIGIYDANRSGPLELFHAYKIVFLCELLGGAPMPGMETSAVGFFSLDELPERLSGERTLPRHIQDAFACLNNPDLRTVFD